MIRKIAVALALAGLFASTACGGHGAGTLPAASPGGSSAFAWGREQLSGAKYIGAPAEDWLQVNVGVRLRNEAGLLQYADDASNPNSPVYRHFLTPQQIGQMFGATDGDYQQTATYFRSNGLAVAGWPQHLILSVSGPRTAMERAFNTKFGTYSKNGVQFVAPTGTPSVKAGVPIVSVANLVGYASHALKRHFVSLPPRANGGFFSSGYSPQQIRKAFDFTGPMSTSVGGHVLDGTGITVGIIGTGPIDVNRSTWCGDNDLNELKALYNVSAANVCEVNVTPTDVAAGLNQSGIPTAAPAPANPNSGPPVNTNEFPYSNAFGTPPPVTSPNADACAVAQPLSSTSIPRDPRCNPEDSEAQLDTQQIATLVPGANVNFYLAYNANDCSVYYPNPCQQAPSPTPAPTGSPTSAPAATPPPNLGYPAVGLPESDPEIQEAIAKNQSDVLSLSYGGGEADNVNYYFDSSGHGFGPDEFAALAAEGVAVFVSSGDTGVEECSTTAACVGYPAGDPNVTSVGGVNAPLDDTGNIVGNLTAWGSTNGGNGGTAAANWTGSGGGISTIFAAPSWQRSSIGVTMREQPDASMVGDTNSGVTVAMNTSFGAQIFPVGGTSVAAPQMAAMWAMVLQACRATPACTAGGSGSTPYRLGNAAPYFYSVFKGANLTNSPRAGFTPALPYAQVFYDVVYGENTIFNGNGKYTAGYAAGPGFDLATGLGVPFGGHLAQSVTGQQIP